MDYVNPKKLVKEAVLLAGKKASLRVSDMLIRGALAVVFLGFATSLAIVVTAQGALPVVGAILFPVGFVMLALLGLELATGNFAMLPAGLAAGTCPLESSPVIGDGCISEISSEASYMQCCFIGALPVSDMLAPGP